MIKQPELQTYLKPHPISFMPSSFFLSFMNPDLTSAGGVPKQDVPGIGLVPRDPGREVDLDWMCCGRISLTSLYVEADIGGPR